MYLRIAPTRLVTEIQKEFNAKFPFLRLEFFQNRPTVRPGYSVKKLITHNGKIGDVQSAIIDGELPIADDMKVGELERIFKDQFGLITQVFRRSGNLWLETTMTDSWTLGQQNEHGKEISTVSPKKSDPTFNDYDLNRDADR
jgi:hypothetical protein